MVIWLDSARKQLQWRLIYATFDVDSAGFARRTCVFRERSIPFGTETSTAESYAAANAQSVDLHSETGTIEGKSVLTQTSNAGQYAHRRLDSKAAGLPYDRGPSRGRWSDLLRQTGTRNTERTL